VEKKWIEMTEEHRDKWMPRKKMLLVGALVSILLSASILGVLLMQDHGGGRLQPSFDVFFSISKPPALNETANISVIFTAKYDVGGDESSNYSTKIAVEIVLPPKYGDGFEWVGEQPRWIGKGLKKGESVELNGTIRCVKTGNWTIATQMLWITAENYSLGWNVTYDGLPYIALDRCLSVSGVDGGSTLYIEVHENSASIHDGPFPEYRPSDEEYNNISTSHSILVDENYTMFLGAGVARAMDLEHSERGGGQTELPRKNYEK